MNYRLGQLLPLLFFKIFYRLRVEGKENIPATGGAVIASNHASFLDPLAVGCGVWRRMSFIARGSLTRNWIYRLLTWRLGTISIDRDRGDRGALRAVAEALAAGKLCVLFPEGTRSRDGRLGELKRGVTLLARQAGVPIVPVYVQGSHAIWPRQRRLPRLRGRLRVRYGAPIGAEGRSSAELMDALRTALGRFEAAAYGEPPQTDSRSAAVVGHDPKLPAAQGCGPATSPSSTVDASSRR